jgi:hypothetical protein
MSPFTDVASGARLLGQISAFKTLVPSAGCRREQGRARCCPFRGTRASRAPARRGIPARAAVAGRETPIADGVPTAAPSSRPTSPARAPQVRAFVGRSRASAPVARSTRPVQLPSASSSPLSSPNSCSIRSSDDAMSLTLKSRATTSARSITGSSMDEGSASACSAASADPVVSGSAANLVNSANATIRTTTGSS